MSCDVIPISANLRGYEDRLGRITGCSAAELAFLSADFHQALPVPPWLEERIHSTRVAVVPLDSGEGIIPGFSEACRDIAGHLGFRAEAVRKAGVAGIAEAAERGTDIFLMADDDDFIAFNPRTGSVVRNRESTARGFITVLDKMCGGVAGRSVLVVGMGPVGQCAADALSARGACPRIYDIQHERCREYLSCRPWQADGQVVLEGDLGDALVEYDLVVDATPASDIIDETVIGNGTFVVAPGVPEGVTEGARRKLGERYHHDKLELGVAVMLMRTII